MAVSWLACRIISFSYCLSSPWGSALLPADPPRPICGLGWQACIVLYNLFSKQAGDVHLSINYRSKFIQHIFLGNIKCLWLTAANDGTGISQSGMKTQFPVVQSGLLKNSDAHYVLSTILQNLCTPTPTGDELTNKTVNWINYHEQILQPNSHLCFQHNGILNLKRTKNSKNFA